MIFFDNVNLAPTPNYYVQKLFSANQGDIYFNNAISKNEKDTTLAASCVMDSKTGDVILKMVNAGNEIRSFKINLSGFKIIPDAELTVLAGNADAENTFENPENVVPVKSGFKASTKFDYTAPAMWMNCDQD